MHIDWNILKRQQADIYEQVEAKLRTLQVGESLAMRVEMPPVASMSFTTTLVLRVVREGETVGDGPWTVYGPMEEHHRRTLEGMPPIRVPLAYEEGGRDVASILARWSDMKCATSSTN